MKAELNARLVGCMMYDADGSVGFGLPVFEMHESPSKLFIQEPEPHRDLIHSFMPFGADRGCIIYLNMPAYTSVGRELIYCFSDVPGSFIHGTLAEIGGDLAKLGASASTEVPIKLQIAELVGSPESRLQSRQAMAEVIASDIGSGGAASFMLSAMHVSLWREMCNCSRGWLTGVAMESGI
jgi:hypothetical protein